MISSTGCSGSTLSIMVMDIAWLAGRRRCDNPAVRKADITAGLVSRLVASQFPDWADLPVRPVDADGWDNASFRLGDTMSVRLPSSQDYVESLEKEQRWLPVLAGQLPLPIPVLLGKGEPGCGFPRPWSVHQWLDGDPVRYAEPVADMPRFASDLAGGPVPGQHNFFRGGPLTVYDGQTQHALARLERHIDTDLAAEVWRAALGAAWNGPPVWFHGDAQPGNLLLDHGRLSAVLDFGTSGIGDPSCDTTSPGRSC